MRTILAVVLFSTVAHAADLTAGAARVDITPPPGHPLAGYYSLRGAEGTHDPLYVKAVVFEKDGVRAAVVVLDLLNTTAGVVDEARKRVEAQTGIPGGHVLVSATHAHTGPVLADGKVPALFGGDGKLVAAFRAGLPALIAEAVKKADAARVPAVVRHAVGREEGLAFNRRYHLRDGRVGWNPGKKNPLIVRPAGPTDPSVPVVSVETPAGKPLAACVNFAMHADTVGGRQYSADYPHPLADALAKAKGDDLLTLFLTGTCGDVNHIDVTTAAPQKGPAEAARIGTRLAAEVLRTWDKLEPAAAGVIRVSRETVELPLPDVTDAEHAAAKLVAERIEKGTTPAPAFLDQVQAFKVLDVVGRLGKPLAVEVQVIAVGDDLAFVGLPGEIFVQLGLDIKHASPFKTTVIAELANGSIGYIPNRVAYPQGAYEVVSARCAVGSGEKLVDSAARQLRAAFKK